MKLGFLSHRSPLSQLLLIFIIVVISFIVITPLGILLSIIFTGIDGYQEMVAHGGSIAYLRFLQVLKSFAIFVVPPVVAAFLFSSRPLTWLWFRGSRRKTILLSVALTIAVQPFVSQLAQWNATLLLPEALRGLQEWVNNSEASARAIIFSFLDTTKPHLILFNIFMIAVLPAIGEEMLFRGAIQPTFQRWTGNMHLAVWFTAFLFSAMHMQFLTFLPRLLLGAMLGYLLVSGGSIWYPVVAHFINNFMALILFHYYRIFEPTIDPLDPTLHPPAAWLVVTSICLSGFLAFMLWKSREKIVPAPASLK